MRVASKLSPLFRKTKNPWDDVETSARIYRAKREQEASGGRNSFASMKSNLIEQIRQNPPRDFSQVIKLIQLVADKPVVLTPLQCPMCSANLQLPASGAFIQCRYCGYNIHVASTIGLLEKILSEIR